MIISKSEIVMEPHNLLGALNFPISVQINVTFQQHFCLEKCSAVYQQNNTRLKVFLGSFPAAKISIGNNSSESVELL